MTICLLAGWNVNAAPGDTTWVQAHSTIQMDHHGNFDTTIEFPDGSKTYRKIIMTFTLGKYQCPGTPQYCGDWDYTLAVHILPKIGDTMEIGRFISPYANAGSPRTPWSWTQRYEFDVTDYYNELKDSATVRIRYSGYSWGFTGDVKFAMIEGTPPRDVYGVVEAWGRSSRFGDTSQANQIEDNIDAVTFTAPNGMSAAELKFTISGHGSDDNGCSEFCKKFYEVELNGNKFDKTEIWRDDCGYNHMYPQSGTWVYNRGNWCPGDVVFHNTHKLNVTPGNTYDLDVDFENYIGSNNNGGSWGSYIIQGNVFYYGGFNKTLDASLDHIVAPTDHETYFRYNPATGRPIVIITNTGSTTITSVKLKTNISGGTGEKEYTWNGMLESLDTAWVEFPPNYDLGNARGANNTFNVEIVAVNGATDDDATNNKLSSRFTAAQTISNRFVILTQTNKGTVDGKGETSWRLVDMFNNIVAEERNNLAPNTLHKDTVELTVGMYKFIVEDAGCEGLKWWANPNDGNGYIFVRPVNAATSIPLNGYLGGDFGCGFTEYLNVVWPTDVQQVTSMQGQMTIYPNPANTNLTVSLDGMKAIDGTIQMKDMTGRVVVMQPTMAAKTVLNVSGLANGVYTVTYIDNNGNNARLLTRAVIAR